MIEPYLAECPRFSELHIALQADGTSACACGWVSATSMEEGLVRYPLYTMTRILTCRNCSYALSDHVGACRKCTYGPAVFYPAPVDPLEGPHWVLAAVSVAVAWCEGEYPTYNKDPET